MSTFKRFWMLALFVFVYWSIFGQTLKAETSPNQPIDILTYELKKKTTPTRIESFPGRIRKEESGWMAHVTLTDLKRAQIGNRQEIEVRLPDFLDPQTLKPFSFRATTLKVYDKNEKQIQITVGFIPSQNLKTIDSDVRVIVDLPIRQGDPSQQALAIPKDAVVTAPDGARYVFVLGPTDPQAKSGVHIVTKRRVEFDTNVRSSQSDLLFVYEGLKPGEQIARFNVDKLEDGTAVRTLN